MNKIKIQGKEYPCRLTVGVLKQYKEYSGKDLQDVTDMFSVCELLFMALSATCKMQNVDFPYPSAEDLMDDMDVGELNPVAESLFGKQVAGEEKKRIRGNRPSYWICRRSSRVVAPRHLLHDPGRAGDPPAGMGPA